MDSAVVPAVEVEDLTVAYTGPPVLWDLDLQVAPGTRTAIVGPNGAGKSTLIKAVMGLIEPVAGAVRIFGKPGREVRGSIA